MKSFNRYSEKQPKDDQSYDDDYLVDYDESDIKKNNKLSSTLGKHIKRLSSKKQPYIRDYIIEYNSHGYIKQPAYSLDGGYDDHVTISMDMIRSIVLVQHCQLEHDQVEWFMDGILWLAHNQLSTSKFSLQDSEALERACEAYFGIPLGLCEDHWAADYLIQQYKRESSFHRKLFKPRKSGRSIGTFLRKLCCCLPMSKKKSYKLGAVEYNEKNYPLRL